ncbi:Clp protease N-terminal domain-containing protein [Rhodococcus sp. T2V]|uniref:Clp protease N-terminal domain-containing protein n=1 Tax=Rhodococcus sp. T2V TaxID=3034164 RepID=UPI0023E0A564|nr:Clp protease N-terminal domain-containing protein [Rhodococcus sp. T2V]MDF3311931.1 Clp protease N-terminal domain-containing protein [Rhodococcus sp. T2V]
MSTAVLHLKFSQQTVGRVYGHQPRPVSRRSAPGDGVGRPISRQEAVVNQQLSRLLYTGTDQTPHTPAPPHPRTGRRHPHITNRGHVITPGTTPLRPRVPASHQSPISTSAPPERTAGNSAAQVRVARGAARSASWCSRDSPIKPATWSSLAAGAARTHHQNWRRRRTPTRPQSLGAGGPGTAALTSWVSRRHSTASSRASAPRRAPPRPPGTSCSPAKTKKVIEGSLRQTALLGHEEVGTDHLLLALLDDPASTGAHILTDLAPAHQRDA